MGDPRWDNADDFRSHGRASRDDYPAPFRTCTVCRRIPCVSSWRAIWQARGNTRIATDAEMYAICAETGRGPYYQCDTPGRIK